MGITDHTMVERNFRTNPVTAEELTNCHWYAIANDTIGGWDIANVNIPDSQRNPYEDQFVIGLFMDEEVAKHIVEIHNAWWDIEVWKSYSHNIWLAHIDSKLKPMIPEKFKNLPKFKELQELFDRSRMKD